VVVHLWIGLFAAATLLACGGRSRSHGPSEGGAGTGGAAPSYDCSGTFAGQSVVLQAPSGATLSSPVISSDERELFYVQYDQPYVGHFRRSTRATSDGRFPDGAIVPELDAACAPRDYRSLDVSFDGLRAYVVCFESIDDGTRGELRVAERRSREQPFTLRRESFGRTGASPALTRDELSLYTSSPDGVGNPPHVYTRPTRDQAFSSGAPVAGLSVTGLTSPEPSPDGLSLFGGEAASIVVAWRESPDAAFGVPVTVISPADGTGLLGAPELSADCGRLYYVDVDASVAPPDYRLVRVTR
jgi:hypothetical protein